MAGRPLDEHIHDAAALVIDGNEVSRRTLAGMLREFGLRRIDQIDDPRDASGALSARRYDIVLCDSHFEGASLSGQELMDELRQAGLLPLSSVVVMISGEGAYAQVAEAAEVALDAYLLKPHTMDALRLRLVAARERKRALNEVITLVGEQQFEAAADKAQALVGQRGLAWIQAARIAADLYLRLGQPKASAAMLEEVLKSGALPWARLGLARAQTEAGAVVKARRTLESLIADQPGYSDAYDVLGRVLFEQGHTADALAALRKASSLTPHSPARLVKLGLMAFYFGDRAEATACLGRAAQLGATAKTFDLQGLVLLAALQFDARDERGLGTAITLIARTRANAPGSARLRRFEAVLSILLALLQHQPVQAMPLLEGLLGEMSAPDFDFEAATNLLMVLARLDENELHLADIDLHIDRLAQRFAVSRSTVELLCAALGSAGRAHADVVRAAYSAVCAHAERAVERSLAGEPGAAATALLQLAEQNLNAKLMDLAKHTVERHHGHIADAAALEARIHQLFEQYRSYGTQVRLARVDDARSLQALSRPG